MLEIQDVLIVHAGPPDKFVRFITSRSLFSAACKPWEIMLDPTKGFKESQESTVYFRYVDPLSMEIVLSILHSNLSGLRELSVDEFLDLSIFCDMYHLQHHIKPPHLRVLGNWTIANYHDHEKICASLLNFGCHDFFEQVMKSTVINSRKAYNWRKSASLFECISKQPTLTEPRLTC